MGAGSRLGCVVMTNNAVVWGNAVFGPLLKAMADHGWHVHFFTDPGPVGPDDLPEGVELHGIRLSRAVSPWQDTIALLNWAREIRTISPELVIGNSPKGGLLGLLAARAAGCPVRVYWIRGNRWDGMGGPFGILLRTLDRVTFLMSTDVLAVSSSVRETYQNARFPRDIVVLGHGGSRGVNLSKFAPPEPRSTITASRPRFLYLGRIAKSKGVDFLPDFMMRIWRRFPEATLDVAGPFDIEDPIDKSTRLFLETNSRIAMLGPRDDIERLMARADIFIFPSRREGLPNALLEAQASGLPSLAWDVTGVRDVIVHGITGFTCELGDTSALASAATNLIQNPQQHRSMSTAAQQQASRFSDEFVTGRLLEWIDALVSASRLEKRRRFQP